MKLNKHLCTLAASAALVMAAPTMTLAQTGSGWVANPGASFDGGVLKLDSRGTTAGTSYENQNLNVAVSNGDTISFEYNGPCGGGAPRVFIQGGAFNTFDNNTNQCGTPIGGGWFLVTATVSGITNGTAGHTGIVNDNPANPGVVLIRNLKIGNTTIQLTPVPTNAEQCKNGGWQAMGAGFRNQGQCVSSFKRSPNANK